jgi:ribonuclease R
MEQKLLKRLGHKSYVPAQASELLADLRLEKSELRELQRILSELEHSGQVARIKGDRYILPGEADLIPGRIQITRNGRGFLAPDDPGIGEVAIPATKTGTALHDDHVLVRLEVRPTGSRKPSAKPEPASGAVIRVLERRRTQFVGTLQQGKRLLHVVPDDPRFQHDIMVPTPRDVGRPARAGDKVVVELLEWESPQHSPEGEITEVLGPPDAEGVDMLAVLRQYELPLKFPRKVLQEVKRFGTEVTAQDRAGRTDCRKHRVTTIDPADAKDFDDAFYLEPVGESRWKLWVHIADVSHYVKPGSALDQEARIRGNSTYLVDRVIPMLPEALSNELCSLKPDVDRLTKCVEFLIGDDGKVIRSTCYPAVIHSQRRFSYEEAHEVIQSKATDPIEKMLHDAHRLAQRIRKHRFRNGSLDLDFPETKIRLDERGRVARIEKVENDESHQLIEEFMLLANEAVAGRLMKLRRPSIYRIHEPPNELRLNDYREEVLSHNVPCGNLSRAGEVQKLLRRLGPLAIGQALRIGFLKSLMRARYATTPVGHYGLAKDKYTHFTSPIRRYADLIVHRSLFEKARLPEAKLKETAEHISATERNSSDAERDSKTVKLHAYLQAQLDSRNPHPYTALVTDLRNFGFFVDVPGLGMNGLVPLSLLDDDFYEFDPARNRIQGRRHHRLIQLGDEVEVQIAKISSSKRQIDFRLVPTPGQAKRPRRGSRTKPARPTAKKGAKKAAGKTAKRSRKRSSRTTPPKSTRDATPKPKAEPSKRAPRKSARRRRKD